MKQSKTEKAVFAKLASQKVELSMLADYLDQFSYYRNDYRKVADDVMRIMKSAEQYKQRLENLNKDLVATAKYYNEVETEAKKLGVDLDSRSQSTKSELDELIKESQKLISKLS